MGNAQYLFQSSQRASQAPAKPESHLDFSFRSVLPLSPFLYWFRLLVHTFHRDLHSASGETACRSRIEIWEVTTIHLIQNFSKYISICSARIHLIYNTHVHNSLYP